MKSIHGKRVLITGASTGIGKSTAMLLASKGARLILISRHKARLLQTAKEMEQSIEMIEKPLIRVCDVSNYQAVKEMIHSCWNPNEPIDVLINNAGLGVFGAFEEHKIEDIEIQFKVNFLGAVYCMHEVIPLMKEAGGGLILNVSSIASFHGIPYIGAYAASKAALSSICQSIRAELKGQNIEIKIIYPGYTDTDFFKNEKIVGNVRRQKIHKTTADKVAGKIYELITQPDSDKVMSSIGYQLFWLNRLWPHWLDNLLANYASRLKKQPG